VKRWFEFATHHFRTVGSEFQNRLRILVLTATALAVSMTWMAVPVGADEAAPQGPKIENEDPLEGVNRATFEFNRIFRGAILDPLVDGYQLITPDPLEQSLSNIVSNLSEPVTAVSSLLQGDVDNAKRATGRFLLNTTLGVGGAVDTASDFGVEQRREDLGQAFGAQGVEAGPYIVLPILGPSNLRDATGSILTGLVNPLPVAVQAAQGTIEYSDNQDQIQSIGVGAIDGYVVEREIYDQNRMFEITNGGDQQNQFPTFVEDEVSPSVATSTK
jgi:phospholipid-binding lipoprotein MlaA